MSTPSHMERHQKHQKIVRPDVLNEAAAVDEDIAPQVGRHKKLVQHAHDHVRDMVRHGRKRKDGCESGRGPSAAELAEAIFTTTQALKSTGRFCMEADRALRTMTFPRARVLSIMDDVKEGHVRMSDLAEALGVTARNITTIVDGLESEGMIARTPDPTDRRAILLALTPKGQECVAGVHAMQHSIAERFFAPLSVEERAELLRLLVKIWDNVGAGDH